MNYPIENNAIFNLMVRVLSGEATPDERRELQEWLNERPGNGQAFEEYKKTWNATEKVRGVTTDDLEKEWLKLERRISIADTDIPLQHGSKSNSVVLWRWAAVVAFFMVALFSAYYYLSLRGGKEWVAGTEVQVIELPDGSKVTLNGGSNLAYKRDFNEKTRIVRLTGEAFFEVARNEQKPFVIETADIKIEVLGTSFNVSAYQSEANVEVVVNTGTVAVYKRGAKEDKIVLQPGEKGVYTKRSGTLFATANNDVNYLAWKTKKLIFEDMPLGEVVKTLNRVYHSRIVIKNPEIAACPITTTFEKQSLGAILEVLKATLNLEIHQKDGYVEIRGPGC